MVINKEKGELFPFICPDCRGFYDCEYEEDGFCLCPVCDFKKIDYYEKNMCAECEVKKPTWPPKVI